MTSTISQYKAPRVNVRAEIILHGRTHECGGYTEKQRAHAARVVIEQGGATVNGKGVHGSVSLVLTPGPNGLEWHSREAYIYRDREDGQRSHLVPEATAAMRAALRAAAVEMMREFATAETLAAAEVERLRQEAENAREKAAELRTKADATNARAMLLYKAAEVIAESGEITQGPQAVIPTMEG